VVDKSQQPLGGHPFHSRKDRLVQQSVCDHRLEIVIVTLTVTVTVADLGNREAASMNWR
jgi:hypothetical protein